MVIEIISVGCMKKECGGRSKRKRLQKSWQRFLEKKKFIISILSTHTEVNTYLITPVQICSAYCIAIIPQ